MRCPHTCSQQCANKASRQSQPMRSASPKQPSDHWMGRPDVCPKHGRTCKGVRAAGCARRPSCWLLGPSRAAAGTRQQLLLQPSTRSRPSPSAALARHIGRAERPVRQPAGTPVPHASVGQIGHFVAQMPHFSLGQGRPAARNPVERKLRRQAFQGSWGTRFRSCEAGRRHPAPPDGAVSSLRWVAPNLYHFSLRCNESHYMNE